MLLQRPDREVALRNSELRGGRFRMRLEVAELLEAAATQPATFPNVGDISHGRIERLRWVRRNKR